MSRTRKPSPEQLYNQALNNHYFYFDMLKIDPIKSLLNKTQGWIIEHEASIQKRFDELKKSNTVANEWKSAMEESFHDEQIDLGETEELHLSAIFILTYGRYEQYLETFVEKLRDFHDYKLSLNDLSGNDYLKKSKVYLEKVVGLDLSKLASNWKKIKEYQGIRNKIVHNHAVFPEETNIELIKELNNVSGLSIDLKSYKIQIHDKIFILEFCKQFDLYISGLIKELERPLPLQ